MDSTYFCGICGTKPDQLSHHKSHLQTKKHADNCENFVIGMKTFSILFRQIQTKQWSTSEHADYIISKYKADKNLDNVDENDINIVNDISKWLRESLFKSKYDCYNDWTLDCFDGKPPITCYEVDHNYELGKPNNEFKNWGISRIVKYKETIKSKQTIQTIHTKSDNYYKILLSRYIKVKFNKIKHIRNGLIDLSYLFNSTYILHDNENMEIYKNDALRYSCLLFDKFGTQKSLYLIYNGIAGCIDIEEHPEEKKNYTFYFYKEIEVVHTSKIIDVINYGESRIEKKKIWVSCYMGDFIDNLNNKNMDNNSSVKYSYISNDDFKYFIKESLIEIFSDLVNRTKRIIHGYKTTLTLQELNYENDLKYYENDLKYYENKISEIKELSLSSDIIISITHICQYLFEYNDDLIEYYKSNMGVKYANIEKAKMEQNIINEL